MYNLPGHFIDRLADRNDLKGASSTSRPTLPLCEPRPCSITASTAPAQLEQGWSSPWWAHAQAGMPSLTACMEPKLPSWSVKLMYSPDATMGKCGWSGAWQECPLNQSFFPLGMAQGFHTESQSNLPAYPQVPAQRWRCGNLWWMCLCPSPLSLADPYPLLWKLV